MCRPVRKAVPTACVCPVARRRDAPADITARPRYLLLDCVHTHLSAGGKRGTGEHFPQVPREPPGHTGANGCVEVSRRERPTVELCGDAAGSGWQPRSGELRPIGSSFQHGQSRGQTHAHSMQRLRRRFQRFFGVKQANKAKHLPALRNSSSPTDLPNYRVRVVGAVTGC
jgi:hypothetical protein